MKLRQWKIFLDLSRKTYSLTNSKESDDFITTLNIPYCVSEESFVSFTESFYTYRLLGAQVSHQLLTRTSFPK